MKTLAVDEGECSTSRPDGFTVGEEPPVPPK
jgi:hypothetical protein